MKDNELDLSWFDEAVKAEENNQDVELDLSGFDEAIEGTTSDYTDELNPLAKQVGATTAGVAAGTLAKATANKTGDLISKVANSGPIRNIPVLGDATGAASYALEGKRVVGQKALDSILEESLREGKSLKEKFKNQKKNASRKIGTTLDLLDKKVPAKNYNKYLNDLQKSLKNISPATESGQRTKKELQDALDNFKKMKKEYSVSKNKNVKTGVEDATERLETLKQRLISESEELGETKTFSPNKINESSKRVSAVDLQDGKVRSVPIKSGEYTPIKMSEKSTEYFDKLKPSELKKLEKRFREVKDVADPSTEAFSQATRSQSTIKDLLNQEIQSSMGDRGLEIYKNASNQYRSSLEAEKILPSLFKGELGEIQAADFLRKVGDSNMAGDKKQQIFDAVIDKLNNQSPEVKKRMKDTIKAISDRYELSDRTRRYGSFQSVARNIGTRVGDAVGTSMVIPKKVAGAVIDKLPIIGGIAGAALSYDTARAEGLDRTDAALEAIKQEGVETALGMGSLFMPDSTGPKRGTVEYRLERGEKLEPYEYKELMDKQNKNFEKMSQDLKKSDNKGKQYFGQQLENIESLEDKEDIDRQKFSLLQQPAFRKLLSSQDDKKNNSSKFTQEPELEVMSESEDGTEELQKAKDREAKQLGSGASGDQRSSLDDLMGQLEALQLNQAEKGEMQQAAYNGDMQKLQELIDRLKQ